MWVIQETMLSPNPVLKCGSDEVPFGKLVAFRKFYWNAEEADHEKFRPLRNLWRDCAFTSPTAVVCAFRLPSGPHFTPHTP
jgi:hypothetical protein